MEIYKSMSYIEYIDRLSVLAERDKWISILIVDSEMLFMHLWRNHQR